jgi:hypothetical protein
MLRPGLNWVKVSRRTTVGSRWNRMQEVLNGNPPEDIDIAMIDDAGGFRIHKYQRGVR